ncbi:unnamed protein product [Prunus armeniaca]
MKSILLLSFNDLPYRLKQCFLYCCLFPEDHVIINHRLIRLWIAEGFVEHVKGVTPEEVAKSYIMELVFRNMLQEMFCVVHDGSETLEETGALRLSIQTTDGEIGSCTDISQLRSFLVFATSLNLSGTPIKELPESIGQLRNLQTLNIMEANIEALPRGISKLLNLRHLIVGRSISRKAIGVRIPSSISKMKKLQSLAYIESEGNIIRLIANMTQLTLLGIINVKEGEEEDLCASIQEMKVLSRLLLFVADGEEFLRVEALPSPPPYLDRLYLSGKLEKGIEHLTKLEGYVFESVSKQFTESVREGAVDHVRMLIVDETCKKHM